MSRPFHQRVILGLELESYTISLPEYRITRELAFPRKGVGERGEHFKRDWSIGTEYNSRPFSTIREGLFLVKAGLRKYGLRHYRSQSRSRKGLQLLLTGGWRDRYAGAHIHLSLADEVLVRERARSLASHLHDHLPLLISLGANSPVWAEEITSVASNRIADASRIYFKPISRRGLGGRAMDEMLFSRGRITKPPTMEVRVLDSNLPEFILAAATIVKAASLAWLSGKGAPNPLPQAAYLRSREDAARRGMKARLCWDRRWIAAPAYLDRFIWTFREELQRMDIPEEVWIALRLARRGWNGARILEEAARRAYEEHPQTWQQRFARRYARALDALLSGNTLYDFARELRVELPDVSDVQLGGRRLRLQRTS